MSSPPWSERDSQDLIDFGRYFVPARECEARDWMLAGHAIFGGRKA